MIYRIDEPTRRVAPDERLYFSHRRESVDGICNICRSRARLTFDHVPPAGCDNREDMEVRPMISVMTGTAQHNKPRIIQSGLKYRTICKRCNEFLGSRYDPALIGLARFVSSALTSNLLLPRRAAVSTRPGAILRSVLGHLVAAKVETDSSVFDDEVRPCILDEAIPVPDKYRLHYWIHPHRVTVAMRDSLILDLRLKPPDMFFQLLKFFPFGFWVLDRSDITSPLRFGNFNDVSPAETRVISIDLHEVRAERFPEAPEGMRATFFGSTGGAAAVARRKRRRP